MKDERFVDMVAQDWAARLRDLERLQPRVQSLEHAVTEIRSDFREARTEQQTAHRETHEALNSFRKRMDDDNRSTVDALNKTAEDTAGAIRVLGGRLESVSRKIAFAAGAIWVLLGISSVVLVYRTEVLHLVGILIEGSA
ncbi:hypothetical protein [Marinobacter sp. X15-166B]|uniref:hypothetical protein n=1 Tax=Marinobacter sp. X15-166B TaxID=1897620 RepID=UPI00085C0F78|nr:hypothetical protein [Marinobacter sp. X15-166B]OEY67468.1 hypothetical protein BG841_14180 [Marinobacter sp. X15-166B]